MSACNLNYNVIYIHVPKTAGTSMEHREFTCGGGHQNIEYFYRAFHLHFFGLPKWEDMFKFGFVRNPYDRFASAFISHYSTGCVEPAINLGFDPTPEGLIGFIRSQRDFINNWVHLVPQYKYLCMFPRPNEFGKDQKPVVDFVGRFENLQADWKKVCDRVGVSNELIHWRNTGLKDYDSLFTPESRAMIQDIYMKDFEIFEYDF